MTVIPTEYWYTGIVQVYPHTPPFDWQRQDPDLWDKPRLKTRLAIDETAPSA